MTTSQRFSAIERIIKETLLIRMCQAAPVFATTEHSENDMYIAVIQTAIQHHNDLNPFELIDFTEGEQEELIEWITGELVV